MDILCERERGSAGNGVLNFMYCCLLVFRHLCGSVRGSAGCGLLNCIYCCVFVVGHFCGSVSGLAGIGVLNFMYCSVLCVGHFVWVCEVFSTELCTELYLLLGVRSSTFCAEL